MRYKVTPWHGEGNSVFHVVDTEAPEGEQPAVLFSVRGGSPEFSKAWNRKMAERIAGNLNHRREWNQNT